MVSLTIGFGQVFGNSFLNLAMVLTGRGYVEVI